MYFSASYIFKLLLGAALLQSNCKNDIDFDIYSCEILNYQRPSDNISESPIVRAYCRFEPAQGPTKNEFTFKVLNNPYNEEAPKKFLSRLKSINYKSYKEFCGKFEGLFLALKWARHIYYLNRCVEKYPELQREKEFSCRLSNVIEPKTKYIEDGAIYDFKCKYEEVEIKKYREKGIRIHLNENDTEVKKFKRNNPHFQRRSLRPATQEAEVNFLVEKCLENTLAGSGFRYR